MDFFKASIKSFFSDSGRERFLSEGPAGESFGKDAGKMAIKMGKGDEALQEIFKQKLGGG